jgi:MFS transporter, DHA2 family, multidrug resistance protein
MSEHGIKKWIITITVILAALLELIDTTVVNVSLTDIMGNLGATLEDVAWVITAYAVANVIIVPMTGWLSAKFGRRNYFAFSIMLFTIASFFCGQSTNIWELVAFRFIQGIGGGALLSTSQAILLETFPKEEAGMATALFGLGVVVGPTIGPTLGGYITTHYSWPWIFFINIPLGFFAAFMTLTFIKDSIHQMKVGRNDWLGIFLLILGVGSLQTVLERGQSEDWFATPYITILAFTAVVSVICFIWWELSIEHPVVNLRVLKNRSLFIGAVFTFILGFGLFSSVFVFPIFCQQLLGFTSEQTGLLLMPGSLATIFMMPFVGILMKKKFPPQIMAATGFILFFISTWLLSKSNLQSGESDFLIPLIIRGMGLSLLFVPLTTLALSPLPPKDIAQGAGLNNMMRQLGGSFGVAIMTTFIAQRVAFHRMDFLARINIFNTATQERLSALISGFLAKGFSLDVATQMANKAMEGFVSRQAALLAYMDAFFVVGVFFLFCVPLLVFQRTPKKVSPDVATAH